MEEETPSMHFGAQQRVQNTDVCSVELDLILCDSIVETYSASDCEPPSSESYHEHALLKDVL